MLKEINYKSDEQFKAWGRNGGIKQVGMEIMTDERRISLFPISTRGKCDSCKLEIPNDPETLMAIIEVLNQAMNAEKQGRREAGESQKQTEVKMEKCEICNKILGNEDTIFNIGDRELVCIECAVKEAKAAQKENREIEITENQDGEAWKLCQWCEHLFPESELREEVDLGNLCGQCINGITSRGGRIALLY